MNRLYLVRHGENLANLTLEFSCKLVDYSLTPKGILQAEQTATYFLTDPVDEIYCSPLKRAQETASIIAAALKLKVEVIEEFREVNVGSLELLPPTKENWTKHNGVIMNWVMGNYSASFPEGDDFYTLNARVKAGLTKILAGKKGRKILVVAHGGTLAFTIPYLSKKENPEMFANMLPNCSISQTRIEKVDGAYDVDICSWGSTSHLHGHAAELVPGILV
jgi:broad specificity phosphatase PhoE